MTPPEAVRLTDAELERVVRLAAELDEAERNGAQAEPRCPRFRFFDDVEAESIEKPRDLIEGLFPCGGLIVPFGPPGSGKTFIVLDWAFSVQTGRPWLGRPVRQGQVVYALAEGRGGLGARVRAWKRAHDFAGRAGILFLAEPVSLMSQGDVGAFLEALEQIREPPALVIFDTLARHMIGGDENSTEDMGLVVQAADRIRAATGAAVMYVHHTNKGGELERGSIALRGGADTMILVKSEDGAITLTCEKQKDSEPFERLRVRLSPVGESAAVFTATDEWQLTTLELGPREREALESLSLGFLEDGASATAWLKASGMAERTFFRARTRLVRGGYVIQHGTGRGARYTVSDSGKHALTVTAKSLPTHCQAASPDHCQPPGGPLYKAPGGSDRMAASDDDELERYLAGST